MTKRETFTLLALIAVYYEQFECTQQKIDSWFLVLKDYPLAQIEDNLLSYVAKSAYPPKLSELILKPAGTSRVIPNCDGTDDLLTVEHKPASEKVIQAELRKMREILGIKREETSCLTII
jgi:Loader and inhibitor of phage G40P